MNFVSWQLCSVAQRTVQVSGRLARSCSALMVAGAGELGLLAAVRAAAGEGAALLRGAARELQHAGGEREALLGAASGAAVGGHTPAPWTIRFRGAPQSASCKQLLVGSRNEFCQLAGPNEFCVSVCTAQKMHGEFR